MLHRLFKTFQQRNNSRQKNEQTTNHFKNASKKLKTLEGYTVLV
jgi:hypothetical protein